MKQDEIDAMLSDLNAPDRAQPAPDVLDLTEAMAAPAPRSEGFRTIDGQSDVFFEEAELPPEPVPVEPRRPAPVQDADTHALISSVTSAAVDSAFNSLAHTVLVQNARTLEDLVREMLRPLLKTWLDDNLPGLVERLVRAEIERVSRGRGS
jgi:cell pole-organizing protein PopZ